MTQNKRRSHLRRRSNPKKNKFKITMRMSGKTMIKRAEKMRSLKKKVKIRLRKRNHHLKPNKVKKKSKEKIMEHKKNMR